jgi:hypothetical protein
VCQVVDMILNILLPNKYIRTPNPKLVTQNVYYIKFTSLMTNLM